MKDTLFPDGYLGSTAAELNHQVGNKITPVKMALDGVWQPDDLSATASESKASFIAGLTRAVEESFPVFGGITHHSLSEVVELAESLDWTDREQLQQLLDKCGELRKTIDL